MEDFEKFENTESEIENAAEETAPAEAETIENEVDSEMNFYVDIPKAAQDNKAEQFSEAPKKKKINNRGYHSCRSDRCGRRILLVL